MLVLSRKTGETIRIGENIVVVLKAIQGGRVKIGIDAPNAVHVVRSELLSNGRKRKGADPPPPAKGSPELGQDEIPVFKASEKQP
jgi:carbon storage regulator